MVTGRLGAVVRLRLMVMESVLGSGFEPSIVNFNLPAPADPLLCWHHDLHG